MINANSNTETKLQIIKLKEGLPEAAKINIKATYYYLPTDSVIVNFSYNIKPIKKFYLDKSPFKIEIDGDEKEWGEFNYSWKLEDENSMAFYSIYYDNSFVYFGIKVIDDSIVSYGKGAAFKQDNVGFGFSPYPLNTASMSRGKNWYVNEFWQLITPQNKAVPSIYYRDMPENAKSICVQKDYGYFSEIAVPISVIEDKKGKDWKSIRVNLAIDDNDGDGVVNRFWWQPNWMNNNVNIIGSGTFFKVQ